LLNKRNILLRVVDTDGCIGREASFFNQIGTGICGEIISSAAREGRIGELASRDCTQG
jgi:hypothetical protein